MNISIDNFHENDIIFHSKMNLIIILKRKKKTQIKVIISEDVDVES